MNSFRLIANISLIRLLLSSLLMISILTILPATAGEYSGTDGITELYVNATGSIARVRFSEKPMKNPNNCQRSDYYMIELNDSPGSSRFLSTLLTAYTAKSKVGFWINGCTDRRYWGGTQPKLYDIYMR